jgi:hypothetical protein
MKTITVIVETGDPICPDVTCKVFIDDKSIFLPYSVISAIHCRTKPTAKSLKPKYLVDIDSYIPYYSVLERDCHILATLNRIKERALNQLADNRD